MLWTFLIIAGLIAYVIYKILTFLSGDDQTFYNHKEKDLRNRVSSYYQAMESHDFDRVEDFYQPKVNVYFTSRNVDTGFLRIMHTRYWQRTPEERHEILWDTFRHEIAPDEKFVTLTYDMKYRFRRTDGDWEMVKASTVMKMDGNLRIFYIAGGKS